MSIIRSDTFHQRMTKCYYYKERENYVKVLQNIITSSLDRLKIEERDFLTIFSEELSNRKLTGNRFVFLNDRAEFRKYAISISISIDNFIRKYDLININDSKVFKGRIRSNIHGISKKLNKIIYFSAYNANITIKDLDFYSMNSYIYNTVNKTNYESLIDIASDDTYLHIPTSSDDYTNLREPFMKEVIGSKNKIRGYYCISCKNNCGYSIINGLKRLITKE